MKKDIRQNKCIMTEEGSLRVLLNLTPGRPMVFQNKQGGLLPVSQRLFTTREGTATINTHAHAAMGARATSTMGGWGQG